MQTRKPQSRRLSAIVSMLLHQRLASRSSSVQLQIPMSHNISQQENAVTVMHLLVSVKVSCRMRHAGKLKNGIFVIDFTQLFVYLCEVPLSLLSP